MGASLRAVPDPGGSAVSGVVSKAAASGKRDLLTALRDNIAARIDEGVPPRDLASLSKRLLDLQSELDAVAAAEDGDDVSEAADTPDEPWGG